MIGYSDITPTVENNRTSLRRIARHDEAEFSNASILNSMEKFVKAVNEMEETILIPSRLLDLVVGDDNDKVSAKGKSSLKDLMLNTDLYRLYNILSKMKVELLWSQKTSSEEVQDEEEVGDDPRPVKSRPAAEPVKLGHARCPSTTSMQSMQSASSLISSDSDSDIGIEIDSGLESEDVTSDKFASLAAENFRRHLHGLHRSIKHMTQAAEYLTMRYQDDVGGQV